MNFKQAQEIEKKHLINLYTPIRQPMVIERGQGCLVWDTEGKEYLDLLSGGRAVDILGHCHPKVIAAIHAQAEKILHTSNDFFTEPQLQLAQMLAELSGGMRVFFCNSGAEANEAAIKLARKYTGMQHGAEKYEIISALNSFHGRTYVALAATGQPKYQKGFGPMPPGFSHVPYNDLEAMKQVVNERTCAIILEPIQGESGIYPATEAYLKGVEELCRKHNALLIFDEVQTGMGRTGKFFACEHYGIQPDIITLAKGLAGGIPMGAMLAREPVASAFVPGDHATTFGGSALPAAAAVATIKAIQEDGLMQNAQTMGEYFIARLNELQKSQPVIKEVRGKGLMIGIELSKPVAPAIKQACLERGVLLLTVGDTILRLLPAIVISKAQIDRGMEAIADAMASVSGSIQLCV